MDTRKADAEIEAAQKSEIESLKETSTKSLTCLKESEERISCLQSELLESNREIDKYKEAINAEKDKVIQLSLHLHSSSSLA